MTRPLRSPIRPASLRWSSTAASGSGRSTSPRPGGPSRRASCGGSRSGTASCSGEVPNTTWFDGGHLNASVNCLDRIVDGGRGDKTAILWEGEPVDDDGKTPREVKKISYRQLMDDVCRFAQRAQGDGRASGRRRDDLHADGARGGRGDAGVCTHRRTAQRDLRRLQLDGDRRPHRRCQEQVRHHRRRRLASRQGRAAQGQRRRSGRAVAGRGEGRRAQAVRQRHHDERPRRLVARRHRRHERPLRAGVDGERGPAVRPLHQRLDRQAQGHSALDGRLPVAHVPDVQVRLRSQGRGRLLVHRRRRLDHRAQLHHLRPAGYGRDRHDVRRCARTSRTSPDSGRWSSDTA